MKKINSIVGKIEKVDLIKSGTFEKSGKKIPYSLYSVIINGEEFRTFDKKFLDLVGKEGEWKFEEEERTSPKGTSYVSKTLIYPKNEKKDDFSVDFEVLISLNKEILDELKNINFSLELILNELKN